MSLAFYTFVDPLKMFFCLQVLNLVLLQSYFSTIGLIVAH